MESTAAILIWRLFKYLIGINIVAIACLIPKQCYYGLAFAKISLIKCDNTPNM